MFLRLHTTKFISFIFTIALLELFIAKTKISSSKTLILRHYPVGAFIPSMTSRHNQQQYSRHYSSTSSSDKRRRQEENNNAPRKNNNEEQNPSVNHNQQEQQTKKNKNDESERQQRREATTDAAPMYITIGPQCCGKSTFLRNLDGRKIKDISLDDQQDVYVPISTDLFLHAYDDKSEENKNENDNVNMKELQHVYQGKSLLDRIRDNVELILILRRWNLDSTAIDFEQRILKYYNERNLSTTVAQALVVAVEDFLSTTTATTNKKTLEMPRETDVFILESLFKPHPETRQSAIQTSYDELRKTPKHIPISW
jgi:ABC-type lipoprotein export system ATPase subunit